MIRFSIGSMEAQARYNVSNRALRFYEERGLISPERDSLNCRRFDAQTQQRLEIIAEFRRAGIKLKEIENVIKEAEGPEKSMRNAVVYLERRIFTLQQQIEEARNILSKYQ